mgnify:CR=1 FL=1
MQKTSSRGTGRAGMVILRDSCLLFGFWKSGIAFFFSKCNEKTFCKITYVGELNNLKIFSLCNHKDIKF